MQFEQTCKGLQTFMEMTEAQVIKKFLSIPGAKRLEYPVKSTPIIFVPGTRKDRVLLVAHYDTIPGDGVKTMLEGTTIYSAYNNLGIGADDRAGCFALWLLRNLGHSLLLVPDEEQGCLGSEHLVRKYPQTLENHQFMIEFDRQDDYDLVYYDLESKEFHEYMAEAYHGYAKARGIFTDICELVPAAGVCGLNVSVGYMYQHTNSELIEVFSFMRTMELTKQLLNRKKLPKFEAPAISQYSRYSSKWWNIGDYDSDMQANYGADTPPFKTNTQFDDAIPIEGNITDGMLKYVDFVQCPHCSAVHDPNDGNIWLFDAPYCLCGSCNHEFDLSGHCYIYPDTVDDVKNMGYETGSR